METVCDWICVTQHTEDAVDTIELYSYMQQCIIFKILIREKSISQKRCFFFL